MHAADLHLDSPLRGLDPDAPAARIRGATREALVNLVDLALQRQVAFVLLSGDLYDGDIKDVRTGHFLLEQLGRLERAGVGVFAIRGNHDAEQVITRHLPFPGTMFRADKAHTHVLDGLEVAIHGQSFPTRAVHDNLVRNYPDPVDGHFNIGLLHTACGSGEHANYAPCGPEDLVARGYDYWALGHVHGRQEVARDPWIVFPGNIQGRHVNEEGAKGVTIVHVESGRVRDVEHAAVDVLRWVKLQVDVTGLADMEAVHEAAAAAIRDALAAVEDRMLAVRLTLHGATPLHAALVRGGSEMRGDMRAAAAIVADGERLWVEDVRVGTRSPETRRGDEGVAAALLAAIEEDVGDSPALLALVKDLVGGATAKPGDDLLAGHPALAILEGGLPAELVERARALVLAELMGR